MSETNDMKVATAEISTKIEKLMEKVDAEKATKADLVELQKQLTNMKATMLAREEDADDKINKIGGKVVLTKGQKAKWAGELAKAFDQSNTWQKADNPQLAKEFYQRISKGTTVSELDATGGAGQLQTLVDSVINLLIPVYGVARNECRVIPGVKGTINLNSGNALPTGGRTNTNSAVRDDGVVTAVAPTFTKVAVTPAQSTFLSRVTEKLVYDSAVSIMDNVALQLAIAAGQAEDAELFTGDGTYTYNSFTGLKTASIGYNSSNGSVRTGSFTTFAPLLQLKTKVHPSVAKRNGGKYYMTPGTFALLQSFTASTSGVPFYDISTGSWKISGSEIVFTSAIDDIDTGFSTFAIGKAPIYYGDLSLACVMAIGRDFEIKVLNELYAASNELGVRLSYDFAFGIPLPAAVARLAVTS